MLNRAFLIFDGTDCHQIEKGVALGQVKECGCVLVEECADAAHAEVLGRGSQVSALADLPCFEVCISIGARAALLFEVLNIGGENDVYGCIFKPALIEADAGGLGHEIARFDQGCGARGAIKEVVARCQAAVFASEESDLDGVGVWWFGIVVAADEAENVDEIACGCGAGEKIPFGTTALDSG